MTLLALPYPAIDPVALQLGPIAIKWYGLAYVAGLLLGWWYVKQLLSDGRLWPRAKAPLDAAHVDDLFLWVALGVIFGGRLGHVLLYEPGVYLANPFDIFKVWKGGMAFHGGMLGTIIAMWLFARARGVPALTVMDLVAAAVPFGLFFGRIANFINAEVVGAESKVSWAMVFPGYGPHPRHPSQLYEAALEGAALFLILRWLTHSKRALGTPGVVGGAFLMGYGAFRMICELFKHEEYSTIFNALPITTGFAYSVPMVLVGWLLVQYARRQPAPAEPAVR